MPQAPLAFLCRMSPPSNKRLGRRLQIRSVASLVAPLLFWLALAAISLLALAPKPPAGADLGWDKLNHFAAFAVLGLLARLAWPRQSLLRWALALLSYGALLELAQGLTPNRQAEWADLLADAVGLLAALPLSWLLDRARQRWPQRRHAGTEAD